MTQNGIIWFKLCRFSGLIYNTIYFHLQKVQILKKKEKKGEKNHFYPPWSFQHTDCYTKNAVEKGVKVKSLHWTV